MAASESKGRSGSVDIGNHIMIAGLSFQVFTLLIFIGLAAHFLFRVYSANGNLRPKNSTAYSIDLWGFTGFYSTLLSLSLSTICIFWRSAFRVAELSDGWTGTLMGRQDLFIGFEGVMISVACLVLNFWHPANALNKLEILSLQRVYTDDVVKSADSTAGFELTDNA
jgi:hypothetical protein